MAVPAAAVAAVALAACLIGGCSQKEDFTPYLEGGLGTDSLFAETTLLPSVERSATSRDSTGDASASKRLVAANWAGSVARAFFYFAVYPDTSVEVTNASLVLYATRVEGAVDPSTFSLYTLADSLIPSGLRWGNMPDPDEEIASFGLGLGPEDSVVIDVTPVVSAWASGASTNRGFMIRCRDEFSPAQAIVEFASHEDVSVRELGDADSTEFNVWPILRITSVDNADSVEVTEKVATQDTFADTLTWERPDTVLTVANGFPTRTFIEFDFSDIPSEATVTRAVLKLTADVAASSFDSMVVVCHAVLDTVSGFGVSYGAAGSGSTVLRWAEVTEDPTLSMDVTPLVQPQVSGLLSANYGLVIKSSTEITDLDFVVFVPTRSGNPEDAPRLEVRYALPPLPWYRRN